MLVVKEAVRVTEAITIGTLIDSYNSAPEFLKPLISSGNPAGPFKFSEAEREQMMELRDQVFRVWGLLRSSNNFDPSLLQPIVQVDCCLMSYHVFQVSTVMENSVTDRVILIIRCCKNQRPVFWVPVLQGALHSALRPVCCSSFSGPLLLLDLLSRY